MRPHRRQRLALLVMALAGAGGSQGGCVHAHFFDFHVSAVVALPPGVPGKLHGSGEAELKFSAFKLRLSGLDVTPTGGVDFDIVPVPYRTESRPIPSLMMLLVFQPSRLGVSFDPTEVWIETHDGRALHPVSYVGPGEPAALGEYAQGCAHKQGRFRYALNDLPRRTEARAWPLPLGSTCFVVAFDVYVSPPHGVIVSVHGIRREGRPVPIPGMHVFRRPAGDRFLNVRPAALP